MQCRQQLATAAMFLGSCVGQTLSREDGPRYSSPALLQNQIVRRNINFFVENWSWHMGAEQRFTVPGALVCRLARCLIFAGYD